MTKAWSFAGAAEEVAEELERVDGGAGLRSKPTFIAAFKISIFNLVKFISSVPVAVLAVFAVDEVLFDPSEYPES